MKTAIEMQAKLNELIQGSGFETAADQMKLGALLLSAGAAFMTAGGASEEQIAYCIEQGRRAARGDILEPPAEEMH